MRLRQFRALSFDCYGTLIDWEGGLQAGLRPLLDKARLALSPDEILEAYARHESAQQVVTPAMPYAEVLSVVHGQLAREWGVAASPEADARFGGSVKDWPAFPDTVEALRYLKQHYQLFILSNVDRASFAGSQARLQVEFDAIYTAQDIGSYKPDPANFRYLIGHLAKQGIAAEQLLHTAQSLFHDHVPARRIGLASAWIDRRHDKPGWGATMPVSSAEQAGEAAYDFRFTSLGEMARAHAAESPV